MLIKLRRNWYGPDGVRYKTRNNPVLVPDALKDQLPSDAVILEDVDVSKADIEKVVKELKADEEEELREKAKLIAEQEAMAAAVAKTDEAEKKAEVQARNEIQAKTSSTPVKEPEKKDEKKSSI